jgi:hypothetical protein
MSSVSRCACDMAAVMPDGAAGLRALNCRWRGIARLIYQAWPFNRGMCCGSCAVPRRISDPSTRGRHLSE